MVQAVIPTTVVALQGRPVATTAPTTGQALAWNGSAYAPAGPFLTAAGAPYIATNYVDNSGFTVNQRGYTSGAAQVAGNFTFDRWKAGASGVTLTFTASPSSTVVTISAGTLQQVIEGFGQINASYTLSWLGSATGRVNTGTYVASPITFTGAPNTNVTIEFQGGTLGQVQLQIGTQPTLWQPRPVAAEFDACQRFYMAGGFLNMSATAAQGANAMTGMAFFPTRMRAIPSILFGSIGYGNASGLAVGTQTVFSFQWAITVTSPGNAFVNAAYSASADL